MKRPTQHRTQGATKRTLRDRLLAAAVCALLSTIGAYAAGPGGACCLVDDCVPAADASECSGLNGFFMPGEDCADDPCGVGACCSEVGCLDTDAYSCLSGGRDFQGAGTTCRNGDPCGLGTGACCVDGACSIESEADCGAAGGVFLGFGTICFGDTCTSGACCVGEKCFDEFGYECAARGGTFFAGAACIDDPCADPKGCPSGSLFSQSRDGPNDFTAGTSELSANFERWEDFSGVAGAIDGVQWWGLDLDNIGGNEFIECVEEDNTFLITFHEDAGGMPGAVVCVEKVVATRKPLGIFYSFAELNEYTAVLPNPCALVNGWISIVGQGDPECWFLWMSAGTGYSWCDRCQPSAQGFDLSLCLFGTEGGVFGACCDDASGVCLENVEITSCVDAGLRFAPDATCDDFDPPCGTITGACCLPDATCSIVTEVDCAGTGGNWLGAATLCTACPCVAVCPAGARLEGEPRCTDEYEDVFNGGCFAETQAFSPIALGDTVCGENGLFLVGGEDTPDFDWYEVTVDKPTILTWEVIAEFQPRVRIIDGTEGCPGNPLLNVAGFECELVGVASSVQPGTYWLVVEPAAFTDSATCGTRYTATLGPDPCPADLDGSGDVNFADLLSVLGAWGPCPPQTCPQDLDDSGAVDFGDLLAVLGAWGDCP